MVSPPVNHPSSAPSGVSAHQQQLSQSTPSSLPPLQRAGSTSTASSRSHPPPNGYAEASHHQPPPQYPAYYQEQQHQYNYGDPSHPSQPSAHIPYGPHSAQGAIFNPNPHNAAYLPRVSSSPPPNVPQYVPPPQHQMPPDPIHSHVGPYSAGPTGPPGGGWGWRPPPHLSGPSQQQGPPLGQPHPQYLPYRGPPTPTAGQDGMPSARSSMSTMPGQMLGRPGSAAGSAGRGGGDRRRRDREEESGEEEVISTIFVVGFPDDMLEREFQNIFTFAQGFEAATLKFPSGSRTREPTAALLAELTQLAALRESAREISEEQDHQLAQHQQGLEEALAALQVSGGFVQGGTASTSTSTTPSGANSLTPAAASGPTLGGLAPTRKQTIGFARFRTRADALLAREQLQGRKIDYLTGATLKAEMAKKNLHTKRTTSGEELVGLLLRSGRLAGLVGGLGGSPGFAAGRDGSRSRDGREGSIRGMGDGGYITPAQGPPSAREAWDSWPASAHGSTPTPAQQQQQSVECDSRPEYPPDNTPSQQYPHHPLSLPSSRPGPASSGLNFNSFPPTTTAHPQYPQSSNNTFAPFPLHPVTSHPSSTSAPSPQIPPRGSVSSTMSGSGSGPTDSKALLALAEEADELEMEMEWSALNGGRGEDHTPRRAAGYSGFGYSEGQQGYGLGGGRVVGMGMGPTSPTGTSEALSEAGRSMGNPADQNPPINTLYIGNLPAVSPPTHPPNFLEESLRNLFSQLAGFKRMSFRQKINGPMCFVEFEDVGYATLAIKEVYGHNLNGLVKGGIRLSYSKNSLGQRGQSHQSGNLMFGGLAHTVALAGMSTSPSGSNSNSGSAQSFSSLGLSQASMQHRDGTTLSPTAQPFTIPPSSSSSSSAQATSPRSRYVSSPPSGASESRSPGFSAFSSGSAATPIPAGSGTGNNGPASPMRSPASFSPASFSWVSTGATGNGYGGNGEGFPSSLGGVASTWGSRMSG